MPKADVCRYTFPTTHLACRLLLQPSWAVCEAVHGRGIMAPHTCHAGRSLSSHKQCAPGAHLAAQSNIVEDVAPHACHALLPKLTCAACSWLTSCCLKRQCSDPGTTHLSCWLLPELSWPVSAWPTSRWALRMVFASMRCSVSAIRHHD